METGGEPGKQGKQGKHGAQGRLGKASRAVRASRESVAHLVQAAPMSSAIEGRRGDNRVAHPPPRLVTAQKIEREQK
jgi:hypothetical protein